MGHSSSITLGIALEKPNRMIYCFDGDGAFLMHEGAVGVNASKNLNNFKHIVFNNEAHDSVGSQPTIAYGINISQIAINSGYKKAYSVSNKDELTKVLPQFIHEKETALLEIKVKCGAREDLGRPKEKPWENKKIFMENLNQVEFQYRGAIKNLSEILKLENVKNILIFTGKKSFENIKPVIEDELNGCKVTYYNDFSVNPKKEEIDIALKSIRQDFDIIVAIGGGSVIDFAKGFRYYSMDCRENQRFSRNGISLIAIPTTAGTGSEATQFSVIYVNGVKKSLDDKSILPEYAIIDSQFVENNPKYLKACTAMDTYCHAIESFWAKKATPLSREYAREAIIFCKENIVKYVNSNDKETAQNMMRASNLAGKAINISRTTASHALSYKITTDYNIPHGHAVALTIAKLFDFNTKNGKFDELKNLIFDNPIEYFNNLFKEIGLEKDFVKLGITDIQIIGDSVNFERLSNNPIKLTNEDIYKLLKG